MRKKGLKYNYTMFELTCLSCLKLTTCQNFRANQDPFLPLSVITLGPLIVGGVCVRENKDCWKNKKRDCKNLENNKQGY